VLKTWAAIDVGVDGIDCSLLGLGGEPHPYFRVPERVNKGNCATEEVVDLILATHPAAASRWHIDRDAIFDAARWLFSAVAGDVFGRCAFADFVPLGTTPATMRH
jgi:isopropylmalate/homocitrate/citramalate synthase